MLHFPSLINHFSCKKTISEGILKSKPRETYFSTETRKERERERPWNKKCNIQAEDAQLNSRYFVCGDVPISQYSSLEKYWIDIGWSFFILVCIFFYKIKSFVPSQRKWSAGRIAVLCNIDYEINTKKKYEHTSVCLSQESLVVFYDFSDIYFKRDKKHMLVKKFKYFFLLLKINHKIFAEA